MRDFRRKEIAVRLDELYHDEIEFFIRMEIKSPHFEQTHKEIHSTVKVSSDKTGGKRLIS